MNRIPLIPAIIVAFILFSISPLSTLAQEDEGEQHTHEHNLYTELFGDGEDTFVCYNRVHRNFYMTIFFTVTGLAVVGFSRYRIKKKAAIELEKKNAVIEEKNKDILDSIQYARRIQSAILPPENTLRSSFPDHFILYKPKDIVSGDFYWTAERNGKAMIAAVDCTGHGVPGAFLSIVGNNGLNKAVKQEGLTRPSEILDCLNKEVLNTLRQGGTDVKDGMDIALCTLDKENNILEFAGAFNPLYLVSGGELQEIRGDRFPVGSTGNSITQQFTNHEIKVKKGDVFYLFSDGYSDQFGGKDGKKFKISRMKELLLSINNKPLDEQRKIIEETLESWRGSLQQVDDILVIGVRV